jgi:hypothetical protein
MKTMSSVDVTAGNICTTDKNTCKDCATKFEKLNLKTGTVKKNKPTGGTIKEREQQRREQQKRLKKVKKE